MALSSMDDKMLGEKVDYYCSSSEDEDNDKDTVSTPSTNTAPIRPSNGKSVIQTGPKGVIEDWRSYQRMAMEKRRKEEIERKKLVEKLSMTCDPNADKSEDIDEEDEKFLEYYNKKRMIELQHKFASRWAGITFGKLTDLDASNYVEEIENEKRFVTIIIHIYDENHPGCITMNGCLQVLSKEYRTVKFCRIKATDARVSSEFINNALPALLAYKNNEIIGNFVHLTDIFGEDFFAVDVEQFLHSYSLLPGNSQSGGVQARENNPDKRDSSDED
uniref:Phosducin-like protein n=1 Tax=Phallusia mammillata TaxID=59560 RepID=A0A6F9DNW7_9ASCI|nr:phosducin-like protein [Phallusia mammillata]